MTDTQQELIDLHRKLAAWHREQANNAATLDMARTYHGHLANLLDEEARRIARQHGVEGERQA
jgi:hypothetical protein